MKVIKVFSVIALLIFVQAALSAGIAQTFSGQESYVGEREKLIVELLKEETKNNPAFSEFAGEINEDLDATLEYGQGDEPCSSYAPLLIEGLESGTKLSEYYTIKGIYGYTFEKERNMSPVSIGYNFNDIFNSDGTFIKEEYRVVITQNNIKKELQGEEAASYVEDNFCKPLNKILEENKNMPVDQLLTILKREFSH